MSDLRSDHPDVGGGATRQSNPLGTAC